MAMHECCKAHNQAVNKHNELNRKLDTAKNHEEVQRIAGEIAAAIQAEIAANCPHGGCGT